ncbi:MAG: aminotransferase class III-fold pyridoxal phosphate-dependent enzyme [Anaerolineales bacterium]|nr:aminotransferase class III-fold pyridoxal phosphate-dependent enzyme [Anaerolineales bacterium]
MSKTPTMSDSNGNDNQAGILDTQPPCFTNGEVLEFARDLYGLGGTISQLDSERDQNFRIDTPNGDQFVIKIANSATDPAILMIQVEALAHIAMVDPELPVPRVLYSRNKSALERIRDDDGRSHIVQILTYMPGCYPPEGTASQALFRPLGASMARLALALRGFYHPAADYELLWDLKQAATLRGYLRHVPDPDHRQLAGYFLDRFESVVLPEIPKLRSQIIHNDFAPNNLVVAEDDTGEIVGILDFGDMIHTPLVMDLAPPIAYMFRGGDDTLEIAEDIIAAYHEILPLEPLELSLMYDLIATRLTMLNVIASWRVNLFPENQEYIAGYVEGVWEKLAAWRTLDPAEVTRRFFRACGFWESEDLVPSTRVPKETRSAQLERRARLLGPTAYLFYESPLHIVRGEGVWLYDDEGNRYLDVYNNVPQVGHCHPHVVKAISQQSRMLNTSTRYLHGLILELAERITSRLPEPLSVCTFVCTGTEANELAWRMAKLVSGNDGALITEYTYHGNSDAIIGFSSEEVPLEKLPTHVATLYAPLSNTTFREPDSGLREAIKTLGERDHQPAMLIFDSGFTSDGIYTSPGGYLRTLFAETHGAGGLCVSDEVQAGFGRLGKHFWGFEFDEVVPDIVTMGKPMGNGHPLAAIVTRPEIAEALAADTGYFNTFGGNPVSCAAGLAVLDVIEVEGLQDNALVMGNYLRERLLRLRKDYPVLGEPHGAGLLLGVDVINADGSPDSDLSRRVMNHMRQNGVLIGTTGPNGNVLKIRPPIVFNQEHAELLLASLANALEKCV